VCPSVMLNLEVLLLLQVLRWLLLLQMLRLLLL
jgi:hypothetical protein